MKLKNIVILNIVIFGIVLLASFYLTPVIINFIQLASNIQLVANSPSSGITTYLQILTSILLILLFPFILYQLVAYIKPALYDEELKRLNNLTNLFKLCVCLFLTGITFGVIMIFQYILPYLTGFNNIMNYQLLYNANEMIIFLFQSILYTGLIFVTPVINYYLLKFKVLKIKDIAVIRIVVILLSVIIGAVITPPDVFSQFLFGLPLYILFEISTLIFKIKDRRLNK